MKLKKEKFAINYHFLLNMRTKERVFFCDLEGVIKSVADCPIVRTHIHTRTQKHSLAWIVGEESSLDWLVLMKRLQL